MLCDAHIHFIPQELSVHTNFYKGVWTDKEKIYSFLDKNQIQKALLVYPSTDAHLKLGSMKEVVRIYNAALEQMIKESPKIIAAGIIDVENVLSWQREVKDLKQKGFKALSIQSSHSGNFAINELRPLFETAQNYNMPIFIHPQTVNPIGFDRVKDPLLMPVLEYSFDLSMFMGLLMMEGILDKYNVKIIFSSLGGVIPFLKDRFDRVYTMLRSRGIVRDLGALPTDILKKVYVDTSGSSLKNIELAIDLFGIDKILWGSDYPVNPDVEQNLSMLDALGAQVKEKIVYKNLLNIFE